MVHSCSSLISNQVLEPGHCACRRNIPLLLYAVEWESREQPVALRSTRHGGRTPDADPRFAVLSFPATLLLRVGRASLPHRLPSVWSSLLPQRLAMITGLDISSPDPAVHRMVEAPFKLSSKADCTNWSTYMNQHMKTKGPVTKKEHTTFLNL